MDPSMDVTMLEPLAAQAVPPRIPADGDRRETRHWLVRFADPAADLDVAQLSMTLSAVANESVRGAAAARGLVGDEVGADVKIVIIDRCHAILAITTIELE